MQEQIKSQKVGTINVGQTVRLGNDKQGYRFSKVTVVRPQNQHYYRIEFEGETLRWVVGASKSFDVVSN